MCSSSNASSSEYRTRPSRRAPAPPALAASLALALAGCVTPAYEPVAFRCRSGPECAGPSSACCPAGYACVSDVCVREGTALPTLLTNRLADGERAFDVEPRGDALRVCWMQPVETQQPGVFQTLYSPAAGRTPARALYALPTDDVTVLTPVTGSCASLGSQEVVAAIRTLGPVEQLLRIVAGDGSARVLGSQFLNSPQTARFAGTRVGEQLWFPVIATTLRGPEPSFWLVTYDPAIPQPRTVDSRQTALPLFRAGESVSAVELLAATGGAWATAFSRRGAASGELRVAWLRGDAPNRTRTWVPWPPAELEYGVGHALAVRGDELAVAYRARSGTTWRIFWIAPGPEVPAPGAAPVVHAGPEIEMAAGIERLGAAVVDDELVVAGAVDGEGIATWSVPWGLTGVGAHAPPVPKLSRLVPRRLTLARVGARLVVVWSERVPADRVGRTEYSALYATTVAP